MTCKLAISAFISENLVARKYH